MSESDLKTVIIDYGMGNLRSVQKAFEKLGEPAVISGKPGDIERADRVVLPGVGAFRDAADALKRQDLAAAVKDYLLADRPFLGICLGMQLLMEVSYEDGEHEGLGIIPGDVRRFELPLEFKIPHMGWNQVHLAADADPLAARVVPCGGWFYFVHSYHVIPDDRSWVGATTDYGGNFVSVVARGNVMATQFHPEKSQSAGLQLLSQFLTMSQPV
ncbi:MAG: imidazole glycerol phosphate synthase subunit HisH [Planctomyces sp.]|jgi:glutamine amidotransferase